MSSPPPYAGHRILEAMRAAPRYADAIYRMIRVALPDRTSRVLDFGAGDGSLARRFLDSGATIDCVEPDLDNRRALAALGICAIGDTTAIPDQSYDFVYTVNVLEHLSDLEHHLSEICRILASDGRLFVFVPAFPILWTSLDDEVHHVRRFRRASLSRALTDADLIVERAHYFDSLGFIAALGVRVLERFRAFRYAPRTIGFYDRTLLPLSLIGDRLFSGLFGKNLVIIARKAALEACG